MSKRIWPWIAAAYLLALVYAGWMPWNFQYDPAVVRAEWEAALQVWPAGPASTLSRSDVRTNVQVFGVAGLLVGCAWWGRRHGWLGVIVGGLAAGLSSALAEAGQLLLPDRVTSLGDVAVGALAGWAGAAVAVFILGPIVRWTWPGVQRALQGRPAVLAVCGIVGLLLMGAAWAGLPRWACVPEQWASARWHLGEGLAVNSWHKWLIRSVAAYGALTLLLAGSAPARHGPTREGAATQSGGRSSRWRFEPVCPRCVWLAVGIAVGVAGLVQVLRLTVPGDPPNLAELLMALMAVAAAGGLAVRLGRPRLELPTAMLAGAAGLLLALAYGSLLADAGQPPGSLWHLYSREVNWEYYRTARSWLGVGLLSAMLGLYLSLRVRWRLRRRMLVAFGGGFACAALIRLTAWALWGRLGPTSLAEQTLAALGGALAFAGLWSLLDRRTNRSVRDYAGPERRGPDPVSVRQTA